MATQEELDAGYRRGLDSARVRYMALSLLLISGHVGGFALKVGQAARPELLYLLVWIAEVWLTFVYWQHFRQSPDRQKESSSVSGSITHDVLQELQRGNGQEFMRRVRDSQWSEARREFTYKLHEGEDESTPHEVKTVEQRQVNSYRRRAIRRMYLRDPETLALRLPFLLFVAAIIVAVADTVCRDLLF